MSNEIDSVFQVWPKLNYEVHKEYYELLAKKNQHEAKYEYFCNKYKINLYQEKKRAV